MNDMAQPDNRDVNRLNDIDKMLLNQIAADRNTLAMQTLYDSYRSRLMPFLRRMTQDHTLIEEVYNDVMLTLWNKSHQFKGNSKVSSWIFSIAYRECLRLIKRQKLRQKVLDAFLFFKEDTDEEPDNEPSNDKVDLLNWAINKLSAKQKLVIELSYFQGHSIQEIGEITNCPANTVKTRLHHARLKIQAFMETAKLDENYNEAK